MCDWVVLHFCPDNWIARNDEWAKECATDRVSTSANIHPEHKDLEGHEGQALVFTKFIQDYCRTQVNLGGACEGGT